MQFLCYNKGEVKKVAKSGFVAVIGLPNVGKSSIINSLVGQKVSITGPKPQTTRNKILGIKNVGDAQIVFVDTPGKTNQKSELGKYLSQSIKSGMEGADVLLAVVDGNKMGEGDEKLLKSLSNQKTPVVLAINKMDLFKFEKIYPKLKELGAMNFAAIVNVSAKTKENLDVLEKEIIKLLPEGLHYYDDEAVTDKSEKFMTAELVREKSLLFLQQEIPHGIAVDVPLFEEKQNIVNINVDIIVSKPRHKSIVIGKGGEMLKKIATSARKDIEEMLGKKVFLTCFVKVEENWIDDKLQLKSIGYDINNI